MSLIEKFVRKVAFTLAEVLIVVTIIGVVAVITMPILTKEISMRVDSEREANISLKITKALENMSVAGEFGVFDSTDDFVDTLQKYLKISKRCDSSNLTDCWPTNTITDTAGKKYEVRNATNGEKLHITKNSTDNVGLILADGTPIILTYNQDFKGYSHDTFFTPISKTLPVGTNKTKDFPYYTSNVTNPIDFVMDVNGASAPNRETEENGTMHDIRSFRSASFSNATCPANGTRLKNGMCMVVLSGFPPVNCSSPLAENYEYCQVGTTGFLGLANDYWAGSFKACDDIDMEYASGQVATDIVKAGLVSDTFQNCYCPGHCNNSMCNKSSTKVVCVR